MQCAVGLDVDGVVGRVLQVRLDLDKLAGSEAPVAGSDGDVVGAWGAGAFGGGADGAEVAAGGQVDGYDEGLGVGVALVGEVTTTLGPAAPGAMAPRMLSPAVCAPAGAAGDRDRTPVTAAANTAVRFGVESGTGRGLGVDMLLLLAMG